MIAIADAVGGDWPKKARAAGVALVTESKEREASLGVRLLADLRQIFADATALPSKTILQKLCEVEESPWGDIKGRPLDERGLARHLRQYGIKSKVIRYQAATPRGYIRDDFHDAWTRYLPPIAQKSATSATSATSEQYQGPNVASVAAGMCNVSADVAGVADDAADSSSKKRNENNPVAGVANVALLPAARGAERCAHCNQPGDLLECHYGDVSPWLHRGCIDAWSASFVGDIPPFLDRRGELRRAAKEAVT